MFREGELLVGISGEKAISVGIIVCFLKIYAFYYLSLVFVSVNRG